VLGERRKEAGRHVIGERDGSLNSIEVKYICSDQLIEPLLYRDSRGSFPAPPVVPRRFVREFTAASVPRAASQ
jgi:hypothetical protein